MVEALVERLQRENVELRAQLDWLRKRLDGRDTTRALGASAARSLAIGFMVTGEIAQHLRELALRCAQLSRESADPRAAQELENISIELAEGANNLEAILASPKPTP